MRPGPLLLALALVGAASGCAGPRVDYAAARADLAVRGSGPLRVQVLDRRPDVVAGVTSAAWVGVVRITMGIPREARTRDGLPLATDVETALRATLAARGFRLVPRSAEEAPPGVPTLTLELASFSSDGYFGEVTLTRDATLTLSAPPASPVRAAVRGKVSASYESDSGYGAACVRLLQTTLEALFAAPKMKTALARLASPRPGARRAPPARAPSSAGSAPAPLVCPVCGAPVRPGWTYCPRCGAALPRRGSRRR